MRLSMLSLQSAPDRLARAHSKIYQKNCANNLTHFLQWYMINEINIDFLI